jgi:hypothetical protein
MPLNPPQPKILELNQFSGLDLEESVLTRPVNTFRRLDNFDLFRKGAVRKSSGISKFTSNSIGTPILGLVDFRLKQDQAPFLVSYGADGMIYVNLLKGGSNSLICNTRGPSSVPYMAPVPGWNFDDEVYYLVVTRGLEKRPVKIGYGDSTTVVCMDLGVAPPEAAWGNNLNRHSLLVWNIQLSPVDGIELNNNGRRYRWTYYNPITGHDSSMAPVSVADGTAINKDSLVCEVSLRVRDDQTGSGVPIIRVDDPTMDGVDTYGTGYTQIRFWATQDAGEVFSLLPILYWEDGTVASDENGAIDINTPIMGNAEPDFAAQDYPDVPDSRLLYDGVAMVGSADWGVDGGSQTGSTLITKQWGGISGSFGVVDPIALDTYQAAGKTHPDYFMIEQDGTIYQVTGLDGDHFHWKIAPPLFQSPPDGALITFQNFVPTRDIDFEMVFPSDDAGQQEHVNDPPPPSVWGAVYQNRLWLVSALDRNKLVFSKMGDYESFPATNYIFFLSGSTDEITALVTSKQVGSILAEGKDQRLIVSKQRSMYQISGVDFTDFTKMPYLPSTGVLGRRAMEFVGGSLFGFTKQGIEVLEEQRPTFIGSSIRQLFSDLEWSVLDILEGLQLVSVTELGIALFAYRDSPNTTPTIGNTRLLMIDSSVLGNAPSPFSCVTDLPTPVSAIYETRINNDVDLIAGGTDGWVYKLFDPASGTDGTEAAVVAVLETQEIPQEDKINRKLFRKLRFDGNSINDLGWKVCYSVDGQDFTEKKRMWNENFIGLSGKTLSVQITHDRELTDGEESPFLGNMSIEYTVVGDAR